MHSSKTVYEQKVFENCTALRTKTKSSTNQHMPQPNGVQYLPQRNYPSQSFT